MHYSFPNVFYNNTAQIIWGEVKFNLSN